MKGIDVIVEQAGSRYQIAIVRVLGQIDTTTSHELERRLQYLLKDRQFDIVIELSRVTYISSAGWGIFISEIRGIRESGGDLKLVGMTPEVAEVFELLEFHNILESFKTVEAAVEKFEKSRTAPAPEGQKLDESSRGAGSLARGTTHDTHGTPPPPHGSAVAPQGIAEAQSTAATATGAAPQSGASPTPSGAGQTGGPGAARESTGQVTRESAQPAREAKVEAASRVDGEQVDSEHVTNNQPKPEVISAGTPGTVRETGVPQIQAVSKDLEAMILEIVREHPDYGCLKIRKELLEHDYRRPMTPLALFMELKRLNLETKEKRKRYADSFAVVGSKK
jgi:anti-sigma B factor antagonist